MSSTIDRMIPIEEVSQITGLARSSIYELTRKTWVQGLILPFPRPVKLGPRRSRWRESAVRNWLAEQEAASQRA